MRTGIMGVGFDPVTMEQALQCAEEMLAEGGFHYAVTPNAEFVQWAKKDDNFLAALNGAHLVLPDGIGVIYASKILGCSLPARVPGCDFAAALCDRMGQKGQKLFLLGAKPGVAELAGEKLAQAHPGLVICGVHDGYFKEDAPVVEAIRASGADVVFVCLGAPKQEYWMIQNGPDTGAALLIGLGGSLDVFAGTVKRAPKLFQKLGLEWFYRLIRQPWRAKRMAQLPLFLVSALKERVMRRS